MKKTIVLIFSCLSLFLIGCNGAKKTTQNSPTSPSSKEQGIKFVKSEQLAPLLEQAKAEDKLVFIDFYTTWCLPCRIMDEEVFSQESVGKTINKNFISYKVDAEKSNGPSLSTIFNVYAYPTLIMVDSDGNVLERKDGALSTSQFLRMADRALAASF